LRFFAFHLSATAVGYVVSILTPVKTILLALLSVDVLAGLFSPVTLAPQGVVFQVSVAPSPDEDLASECQYELTLPDRTRTVESVWVIFDRGRDMLRYYGDPDVYAFAQRHGWALLLPFHCRAKSGTDGDMNMDPSQGVGRALVAALSRFGELSGHRELASAKLILLGFSGTGVLVARFPDYLPDRVVAVMATHAGHNPRGLDTINLSSKGSTIPQLIVAGSTDRISGTQRPYDYFRKHFDRGAPWTFVMQNKTPHCCVINIKSLMLEWLEATVPHRIRPVSGTNSYGFIRTAPETREGCPNLFPPAAPIWCDGTKDAWDGKNWSVTTASVEGRQHSSEGMQPAGWLPTAEFAKHWLSFIRQQEHPVTSLP
jgi:hypothetical protein